VGHMADYHFVSTCQIQAPIERVREEIYHAERWPTWWKYVVGVDELDAEATGELEGTGRWRLSSRRGRGCRAASFASSGSHRIR
jgi:hypothetical protein